MEAFRRADPVNSRFIDFVRSENSFPHFWLACTNNEIKCIQISPNLRSTAFLPANAVNEYGREIIEAVLNGEMETYNYQIMLSEAYNYAHYGRLELALVHVSIACEIAISLHLIKFLKHRNVSNTKLDDHFDNITYSQTINIHLFSMYDMSEMDNFRNKIGQIDWARKKRNKIVHEGGTEKDLSRNAVEEALDAATDLINFMTTNVAETETPY